MKTKLLLIFIMIFITSCGGVNNQNTQKESPTQESQKVVISDKDEEKHPLANIDYPSDWKITSKDDGDYLEINIPETSQEVDATIYYVSPASVIAGAPSYDEEEYMLMIGNKKIMKNSSWSSNVGKEKEDEGKWKISYYSASEEAHIFPTIILESPTQKYSLGERNTGISATTQKQIESIIEKIIQDRKEKIGDSITEKNLIDVSITLERGALLNDTFILKNNKVTFIPSKEIPQSDDPYFVPSFTITDEKETVDFINELLKKDIFSLEKEYSASKNKDKKVSDVSMLKVQVSIGDKTMESTCEDYKKNCPDILQYLETKIIELHGKDLQRISTKLPG